MVLLNKMSKVSAGVAIIYQNKILLVHPTNAGDNLWGVPKGGADEGETTLQTAIRETKEEIGYLVNEKDLEDKPMIFVYTDKKGKKYKEVFCYVLRLKEKPSFVDKDKWPTDMLQIEEIDKAKFFTKEEAEKKIFWRFKGLLNLL